MPTNEFGHEIDENWVPDNPTLRGLTRSSDPREALDPHAFDTWPHRVRRAQGLDNDDPDPGYDPAADDLI